MTDELTALRARVAELADRWLFIAQHPNDEPLSDYHRGFWQAEIDTYTECADALLILVATSTPDPRDARIAGLEAALREGLKLIAEAQQDAYWRTIERAKDVLECALGEETRGG